MLLLCRVDGRNFQGLFIARQSPNLMMCQYALQLAKFSPTACVAPPGCDSCSPHWIVCEAILSDGTHSSDGRVIGPNPVLRGCPANSEGEVPRSGRMARPRGPEPSTTPVSGLPAIVHIAPSGTSGKRATNALEDTKGARVMPRRAGIGRGVRKCRCAQLRAGLCAGVSHRDGDCRD